MKAQKKKLDIISVQLSPESKAALDQVCAERGMTIKALLGRLISWFDSMDRTEQSVVLGQIESADVRALAGMLVRRHAPAGSGRPRSAAKRPRR